MIITLDPRAGSGDLKPLLEDRVTVHMVQMPFGDAAFDGHGPNGLCGVGVEIKKLDDVLDCAIDKRYSAHQLVGMWGMYDFCYLLIEGRWHQGPNDRIMKVTRKGQFTFMAEAKTPLAYSSFMRWINTIRVKAAVYDIYSFSREGTASLLVDLAKWWAKPWKDHSAHLALDRALYHRPDKVLLTKPSQQRTMVGESPGIGWEKSQRVLQHFGSIHAAVNAPVAEWLKIEGIGPKTAEFLYRFYRKDVRKR